MSTAALYIRVSTDEQAQKGYSQKIQYEHLQKFCLSNNIEVLKVIYEDHSAKTFVRSQWSWFIRHLESKKSIKPDQVLFTKWDRFSRNAADAYYMIEKLKKFNVQPVAIDQKLDLSIPENKIMLAIYLSTSEVENDRRSINVKQGIHRAKESGRCTSRPPYGYKNVNLLDGTKTVITIEPEATFVRKIFECVAKSGQSIQSSYRAFLLQGLKCSRNNFWSILRNPFYCGFIIVREYNGDKKHIVKGLHEGIISEELFNQVKKALAGRQRVHYLKTRFNPFLLLRGLLLCPICNKKLTGSRSKGKLKHYHYYHCSKGCKYRVRADYLNNLFLLEIRKMHCIESLSVQFKSVFKAVYEEKFGRAHIDQKNIFKSIDDITERLVRAKTLAVENKIANDDFQLIKADCERKINLLGLQIKNSTGIISKANNIIADAMAKLQNLDSVFNSYSTETQKKLIDLICERQIIFDGIRFISLLNTTTKKVFGLKDHYIINAIRMLPIKKRTEEHHLISPRYLNSVEDQSSQSFLANLAEIILQVILNKC